MVPRYSGGGCSNLSWSGMSGTIVFLSLSQHYSCQWAVLLVVVLVELKQYTLLEVLNSAPCGALRDLVDELIHDVNATCLLYTSPSPRDRQKSRMPSSA